MRIVLDLPLPPSVNVIDGLARTHIMAVHGAKVRYMREAWREAIRQHQPLRDPPPHVTLSAHFRVHNLRDEDKLSAGLWWPIDALKQAQSGKDWRAGVYSLCGYFMDDDPKHLTVAKPTQEIDRKHKGLTLTLEWANETEGA